MTVTAEYPMAADDVVCRDTWLAEMYTADPDDESLDDGGDPDGAAREAAYRDGFGRGRTGEPPGIYPTTAMVGPFCDGYMDGFDQLAAVEAAALADPDAWLTLPQWETLDAARDAFPTADWNPSTRWLRLPVPLTEAADLVPCLAGFRILSARDRDGGCWIDLNTQEVTQ